MNERSHLYHPYQVESVEEIKQEYEPDEWRRRTSGGEERARRRQGAVSVYVIADRDANRVKVGISSNPKKRLRSLCFPDLEIMCEIQMGSRDVALYSEQTLLDRFSKYRIGNSEWLRCSDELNADNAAAVLNDHVVRIGFAQASARAQGPTVSRQALRRYIARWRRSRGTVGKSPAVLSSTAPPTT